MCIRAIRLDKADELHFKILFAMFDEVVNGERIKFAELSKKVKESEETIRYNVKKLEKLGYIRTKDDRYELTEKVILVG